MSDPHAPALVALTRDSGEKRQVPPHTVEYWLRRGWRVDDSPPDTDTDPGSGTSSSTDDTKDAPPEDLSGDGPGTNQQQEDDPS